VPRAFDHTAVLLPGDEPRGTRRPDVGWARLLFVFLYVTASACVVVLLGLAWRDETHRRHAAEATAATSGTALRTAQERIAKLDQRDAELTSRVAGLSKDLRAARSKGSRRGDALRDVRSILRSTATFFAALDGLDETVGDTVESETALPKASKRLAARVKALDAYLRATPEHALDRALLRARLRVLVRELTAVQTVIAQLTEGKEALAGSVEPLGQMKDLDRTVRAALERAKIALRR
jgi:chromosome segregation ATPase